MRLVSPVKTGPPASVNRYLLPQERPVITVRMHPATLTAHLVMAGGGLLAAWKLASRSARPEIAWGAYLLLPLYFLYRGAAWPATYLPVTNERMMLIRGVLTRTAAAIPLQRVAGLTLQRTVPGRLLGYGTLIVDCPGRRQVFRKVRYLPYPEQLYLEISSLLGREELDETAHPAHGGEGMTEHDSADPFQQE
jgi:Bacterial PH domain